MFDQFPDLSYLSQAERQYFTFDRRHFLEADAVVFHLPSLPPVDCLKKPSGQVWIAWSMESATNYPYLSDAEFLKAFDYTMTYQRRSDVWCSYFPQLHEWEQALSSPLDEKTEAAPVVMFQSSNFNRSGRMAYVQELMHYIDVDSYGRAANNRKLATKDVGRQSKLSTIAKYKFCIAMENSVCEDYVTEKLFDPLLVGAVPVYLGAPNVVEYAPSPDSYIDASIFSSALELADHLKFLSNDDAAYQRFFQWRRRPLNEDMRRNIRAGNVAFKHLLDFLTARPHPVESPLRRFVRKQKQRMLGRDAGRATAWSFDPGFWAERAGPREAPAPTK